MGLGVLGFVLGAVAVFEYMSGDCTLPAMDVCLQMDSISATYFTSSRDVFVGILTTIGFCFFYYQGFPNEAARRTSKRPWDYLSDAWVSSFAGAGALMVAFFPHRATDTSLFPAEFAGLQIFKLHYFGAIILFGCMALFCLFLFTRGNGTEANWDNPEKQNQYGIPNVEMTMRNRAFIALGILIVISILWTAAQLFRGQDIFLPELFAILFFCMAWVLKFAKP